MQLFHAALLIASAAIIVANASAIHSARAGPPWAAAAETTTTTTSAPAAPPPTAPPPKHPPKLPYKSFLSWAVQTVTAINAQGNATTVLSVGGMLNVQWEEKVMCQYKRQQLLPVQHAWHQEIVSNYSSMEERSRIVHDNGDATNCTFSSLRSSLLPGGGYQYAPSEDVLSVMKFLTYTYANGDNCTVWQATVPNPNTGLKQILTWTVGKENGTPQVYVNQTFNADGTSMVYTTAYNGYHQVTSLSNECYSQLQCGENQCVLIPGSNQTKAQSALGWVCSQENCTTIGVSGSRYYPNTLEAHATWAFSEYYNANKLVNPNSCGFGGSAMLHVCTTVCQKCRVKANVSEADLLKALDTVCFQSPPGSNQCPPIQHGGSHFHPNTTVAHANWAFQSYYEAYKCVPNYGGGCGFNGVAELVPCDKDED